jgi:hypothetical protein
MMPELGMDQPGNLTREEYRHDTVRINFYKNYLTELKKGLSLSTFTVLSNKHGPFIFFLHPMAQMT